ncbi:hypothetical protein BT63DRAFT_441400 [Microthyrium microscopicum]|uniref:DUF7702 domain-containing protein n=1 Tax=Microthyrium microscopicum TaxID=703497 RepID=A0A6A6U8B8_9PEZI|nr:hypothetical protein BT63DRAFT_441400 [Microthyrium microscopicum]
MGGFDATTDLAIAELVIYILLLPVFIFVLARHGKHGIIGWLFLALFAVLRIIADGFQIDDRIKQNKGEQVSSTGAIINSVGVSPLLIALASIVCEAATYTGKFKRMLNITIHVFFHFLVGTGIAIVAVGSSNLYAPASSSNSYSSDQGLVKGGYIILLLTVIIIIILAVWTRRNLNASQLYETQAHAETRNVPRKRHVNAKSLVNWALVATIFVAIRVIYGIVYAFSNEKASLSPATGSFEIKFWLIFLVQLIAACCLLIGGVVSMER